MVSPSRRPLARVKPAGRAWVGLAIATLVPGCPSLPEIPLGQCGNGVIEPELGEECDTPEEADRSASPGQAQCALPGDDHECRFIWDEDSCCPAGTSEGADRRCRAPTNLFAPAPLSVFEGVVRDAATTDVDGDGWRDLVVVSVGGELDVRYFGPNPGATGTRDVRRVDPAADVAVGYLSPPLPPSRDVCDRPTVHPRSNLLVPTDLGVRILTGQPDGTLLPKALAAIDAGSLTIPFFWPGRVCGFDDGDNESIFPREFGCAGALAEANGALDLFTISIEDDTSGTFVPRARLEGASLADVRSPPRRIGLPSWSGCDGIVLGLGAGAGDFASSAVVLGGCDGNDPTRTTELARVPMGADELVFVADGDGDGIDDLVLASSQRLRILPGDGEGNFGGAQPQLVIDITQVDDDVTEPPLAVGDLDGDGVLDVVQSFLILASNGRCTPPGEGCNHQVVGIGPSDTMTEAVLADVNRDGRTDVVAAGIGDSGHYLAVFSSSGSEGILTTEEASFATEVRGLDVADLDGDGGDDVTFVVRAAVPCVEPDAIRILHGGSGRVADAVTVAGIPGVIDLALGVLHPSDESFDGLADIGLTTACPTPDGGMAFRAALLRGTPTRGVDSPYPLRGIGYAQESIRFATGRILVNEATGDDPHHDLVAVAPLLGDEADPLGAWWIEATGAADLPPNASVEPKIIAESAGLVETFALVMADLDCQRGPEAGPCAAPDEAAIFESVTPVGFDFIDQPRLTILSGNPEVPTIQSGPCAEIIGSRNILDSFEDDAIEREDLRTNAEAFDVDGDGWLDIVGWWTGDENLGRLAGSALIYWNGPDGFVGTCPSILIVPEGEVVRRVTAIRAGFDHPTLAIGTDRAVYLATPGDSRRTDLCASAEGGEGCIAIPAGEPLRDLAVLDANQDGLDDLLVFTHHDVEVLAQRPSDQTVVP